MVLRKSFYIRWSAGRSPRVHEVNPGRVNPVHEVIPTLRFFFQENRPEFPLFFGLSQIYKTCENI